MTPIHQQIVDTILERMHQRVQELIQACQPACQTPIASPTKEQLRQTVLGQHLAAIAYYVPRVAQRGVSEQRFGLRALFAALSFPSCRGICDPLTATNRGIEQACEDTSAQKCISLRNPWVRGRVSVSL